MLKFHAATKTTTTKEMTIGNNIIIALNRNHNRVFKSVYRNLLVFYYRSKKILRERESEKNTKTTT